MELCSIGIVFFTGAFNSKINHREKTVTFLFKPGPLITMDSLRDRFLGFPWIPSFVVSILSGLVFYVIENSEHIPRSVREIIRLVLQYSIVAIAIGGLVAGCLSLYYTYEQKSRWNQFEKRLENRSSDIT